MITEQERKDALTCVFLLVKLKEVGFIGGDGVTLTTEGFEEAMVYQDQGYKVTKDTLLDFLPAFDIVENKEEISKLAMMMQDEGFDVLKREADNLNKPWYKRIFTKN